MRGNEVVAYFGGSGRAVDPGRVRRLAERFELDLGRRFRESSPGDRQKLCILLAFMRAPDLLILDEPFAHLDDRGERELQSLIEESRIAGATVFLADPVPSAVEHLCDRVVTLRGGRLLRDVDGGDLALHA
jgi:ABC-2 type transport system ATP-binding protein